MNWGETLFDAGCMIGMYLWGSIRGNKRGTEWARVAISKLLHEMFDRNNVPKHQQAKFMDSLNDLIHEKMAKGEKIDIEEPQAFRP